jgi:hypothetical protein
MKKHIRSFRMFVPALPPTDRWDQERQDALASHQEVMRALGSSQALSEGLKELRRGLALEVAHGVFCVGALHFLIELAEFWRVDRRSSIASRDLPDGRRLVVLWLLFEEARLVIGPMSFDDPSYERGWVYSDRALAVSELERWNPALELEPTGWRKRDQWLRESDRIEESDLVDLVFSI